MKREYFIAMEFNVDHNNIWSGTMDTYNLLMGYAYHINPTKAYDLYRATTTDFSVNLYLLDQMDDDDPDTAIFLEQTMILGSDSRTPSISISELPSVINFINTEIIPSLDLLPNDQDITSFWPMGDMSTDQYLSSLGGFIQNYTADSDDFGLDVEVVKSNFEELVSKVFNQAILQNKMYEIIVG